MVARVSVAHFGSQELIKFRLEWRARQPSSSYDDSLITVVCAMPNTLDEILHRESHASSSPKRSCRLPFIFRHPSSSRLAGCMSISGLLRPQRCSSKLILHRALHGTVSEPKPGPVDIFHQRLSLCRLIPVPMSLLLDRPISKSHEQGRGGSPRKSRGSTHLLSAKQSLVIYSLYRQRAPHYRHPHEENMEYGTVKLSVSDLSIWNLQYLYLGPWVVPYQCKRPRMGHGVQDAAHHID